MKARVIPLTNARSAASIVTSPESHPMPAAIAAIDRLGRLRPDIVADGGWERYFVNLCERLMREAAPITPT